MMKNIGIARQLIGLAKSLVADEGASILSR